MAGNGPEIQSPTPEPQVQRRKATGVVIPHKAKWYQRLAALLIYLSMRGIAATVRFRLQDDAGTFVNGPPKEKIIFAIWHNRLSLAAILYQKFIRRHEPERKLAGLVSASKDGGLLARILELFNVEPVRGSSSRRGPQALRELITLAERGYDLAITPDGPRGPCYEVQEGPIAAAQLTGFAIAPISYRLAWKVRVKSWDRFQIPLPFTRCDVVAGPLMRVPREMSDAEREELKKKLQETLREITRD